MTAKGFERLTPAEVDLLLTFDDYGELVLPDLIPNGMETLARLIKHGIVLPTNPFSLSKKGIRLVKMYKDR